MALAIGGNDGNVSYLRQEGSEDALFPDPQWGSDRLPVLYGTGSDGVVEIGNGEAFRGSEDGGVGRATRLIFPGLASDGLPEPEVIASAVSDTVAIPDENPGPDSLIVPPTVKADVTPVPPSNWNGIDAFLAGSPLAGMGNVFIAAALVHGLDPRLMPAIALWESGRCGFQAAPYNCWGLTTGERTPSGGLVFRAFTSYEEAIWTVTETFAGYGLPTYAALCMWVSGRANCDSDYPGKVLNTMGGIR